MEQVQKQRTNLVEPKAASEDHKDEDGSRAEREPSGIRAKVAGLNPASDGAEATCGCSGKRAGAVDQASLNQAAENEAAEHKQRRDDERAIGLVDPVLVVDQRVKRLDLEGERGR